MIGPYGEPNEVSVRDWFRRAYWITDRDLEDEEEADDLGALLVATGELGPEPAAPIDWSRFDGLDAMSVLQGQLEAVRLDRDRLRGEVSRLLDERALWVAMIQTASRWGALPPPEQHGRGKAERKGDQHPNEPRHEIESGI